MDIVSDSIYKKSNHLSKELLDNNTFIPFSLSVITKFPFEQVQVAQKFSLSEESLWQNDIITLSIEEHEDLEVLFDCDDLNAKLYLDALDMISSNLDANIDCEGRLFRKPSKSPFVLYKTNANYDAIRVDVFRIVVLCNHVYYYGTIEVRPKPMTMLEWSMMKDDLEKEAMGLARDIVHRNNGLGNKLNIDIPSQNLYNFLVIQKYAKSVLSAITDITEKPRHEIKTQYEYTILNKNKSIDRQTIKQYLNKNGFRATYMVPIKSIYYDIQDNRLLKMIINNYERRLDEFIIWIEEVQLYLLQFSQGESNQYNEMLKQVIEELIKVARKLRKITAILKEKEWYKSISNNTTTYVPYSFVLDSRYNSLYQMYLKLKRPDSKILIDPKFSYASKRSSYMYEMWSYITICRLLKNDYILDSKDIAEAFTDKMIFPFLKSGTCTCFLDDKVYLHVIFDKVLPDRSYGISDEMPLYIARSHEYKQTHNRPDIIINIYSRKHNCYIGSIILECKYRKLYSFWDENNERSSIEQFQTYYNNARSDKIYGKYGSLFEFRPVREVIVLTPDSSGNNRNKPDFNILVKSFKPSEDLDMMTGLLDEINIQVKKCIDGCRPFDFELKN